jgi:hypothetical protein
MTVCNMAIEAGARAGLVAVDEKTIAYVKGRPFAPTGVELGQAVAYWRTLQSDAGATSTPWSRSTPRQIEPQVTWGTSPEMVLAGGRPRARPRQGKDANKRGAIERALAYMGLEPNKADQDIRSTRSSSARAPTAASRTCARPPPWCAAGPRVAEREAGAGGAGLGPGEGAGRGRGPAQDLHRRRLRVARARLLMCLAMNADRSNRASAAPPPATATSKAARAPAAAPTWSAPRWPPPPPSPATSSTSAHRLQHHLKDTRRPAR